MTIIDLWYMTMNSTDLSVKWAAIGILLQIIQTSVIFISAIVVFFQIRQIQKDAIEKKITGLKTAVDALDNDLFNQVSKQAASNNVIQGANWRKLLNSINLVALLIQEGFTNSQLLLAMKGKELYTIGCYIQKQGLPAELKDDLDDQFKPAIKFLNDICSQAKKLGYID
jgi:hypothetical protein